MAGALTYNLYRADAGASPVLNGITAVSATDNAIGTHNHTYQVRGINACGAGALSTALVEP